MPMEGGATGLTTDATDPTTAPALPLPPPLPALLPVLPALSSPPCLQTCMLCTPLHPRGGQGEGSQHPACAACTPFQQGHTLQVAATCGHGDGSPGFGDSWRRVPGHPCERLSAFQTCPWKRSGPSRLRCKWPQTKSWGASTPKPLCLPGMDTPDPALLPGGGSRQGDLCPPCIPRRTVPCPSCPPCVSPACAACTACPSLPLYCLGWRWSWRAGCAAQHPLPCPSPCPQPLSPSCPPARWAVGAQAAPG